MGHGANLGGAGDRFADWRAIDGAWRLLGEQPEEVAGLVTAVREKLPTPRTQIHLDWPVYAGKRRLSPYYAYVAWQLAQEGYKILILGSKDPSAERYFAEDAFKVLKVPFASSLEVADRLFNQHNLVYLPFEAFAKPLEPYLYLKPRLGVRTIFNSLCKMINPLQAPVSIQGIFHGVYANLHAEVAARLDDPKVISFKGEGGEAEIRPTATTQLHIAEYGSLKTETWPQSLKTRPEPMEDVTMEGLLARIQHNTLTPYDQAALEANYAFAKRLLS